MNDRSRGFIVYSDIAATIDEMTDEQVAQLFRGMVYYFNTGEDPGFDGILKFAFIPIRQQMDRDTDKYERKCERNRENAKKRWGANASERMQSDAMDANKNKNTNTNTNKNKKENTNTNKKSLESDEVRSASPLSLSLLDYLNERVGGQFEDASRIETLLAEGYTESDIRSVIDKKAAEWMGDKKMQPYLRPSTLFGEKFQEYLSAPDPVTVQEEKQSDHDRKMLEEERYVKAIELVHIIEQMEKIRGQPSGIRGSWDEYRALEDRKCLFEQRIESIDRRLEGTT